MSEDKFHRIWAYLHRELGVVEKQQMENHLKLDESLRKDLDAMKDMDQELKKLIPMMQMDETELENRILDMWEHEQKTPAATKDSSPILLAPSPARWKRMVPIPLALAASLAILVGVSVYQTSQPLRWSKSEFLAGPIYRDATQAIPSQYTPARKKALVKHLQHAVRANYKQLLTSQPESETRWELQSVWQELEDGMLLVRVAALDRKQQTPTREWNQYFNPNDTLNADLEKFSAQIANDLIAIPSTGPSHETETK